MEPFIDRLADLVTDPRTDLVLLLGLWMPAIILVLATLAVVVVGARLLARCDDQAPR